MEKKIIGIVVEYNPFHNGHIYQIREIKKKYENSIIIVVMSGNYVQRGEVSIIDKWQRVKSVLENEVDIIIELPVYYSIQNAEVFGEMATKILDYLNVEEQIFGSEIDDMNVLKEILKIQKTEKYNTLIKETVKKGYGYKKAQEKAFYEYGFSDVFKSNNILALEYIRTKINYNLKLEQSLIVRKNVGHNDTYEKDIASASYIRSMIEKLQYEKIKEFVPISIYNRLVHCEEYYISWKLEIYKLFKYKLLTSNKEVILNIYDIDEDLYNRILKILIDVNDYDEFLNKINTKNYSINRIKRVILNILLNIDKNDVDRKIEYARVLGFTKEGQKYIKYLRNNDKKVYSNWKEIEKLGYSNNDNVSNKIRIEKISFLLYEMIYDKKEELNPVII